MQRISWDQYFMAQSHLLASRSTCTRLMVGATIVRDKRIIAGGYNGSVSGSTHCIDDGCYMIDGHCVRTVHAEVNALLQCAKFGVPTENAEIYVTHYPCLQCSKLIIQASIQKVYYAADYRNHEYATELFAEANIETQKVALKNVAIQLNKTEQITYVQKMLGKLEALGLSDDEYRQLKQEGEDIFHEKLSDTL